MSDTTSAVAARIQQEVLAQGPGQVALLDDGPAAVTLTDVSVDFGPVHAVRRVTFPLQANRVTALVGPLGLRQDDRVAGHQPDARPLGGQGGRLHPLGDMEIYGRDAQPELIRQPHRHGLPAPQPLPHHEHHRQRDIRPALQRHPQQAGPQGRGGGGTEVRRPVGDGEGPPRPTGRPALRWPAAAPLHRPCPGRGARGAADGRALLGARPHSTSAIEETIVELASEVTIALVTHNMFQATRCADLTAVFLLDDNDHIGELVEYGATQQIFSSPSDPRTEQYVTGQVS